MCVCVSVSVRESVCGCVRVGVGERWSVSGCGVRVYVNAFCAFLCVSSDICVVSGICVVSDICVCSVFVCVVYLCV